MKTSVVRTLLLVTATAVVAFTSLPAQASHCSNSSTAGNWAYTYTGTIFTPSGPLPAASVGHYFQDSTGSIKGTQSRSVAGQAGVEDIAGTVTVNKDCTGAASINVLVDGQLQRTADLALVYDSSGNHVRMIFQSLKLPDGTSIPVVLTIDANRLVNKE